MTRAGAVVVYPSYGPVLAPLGDQYVTRCLWAGDYAVDEARVLAPYLHGKTGWVLDGGANVGAWTWPLVAAYPGLRSVMVEPQRALVSCLHGTAALNGWVDRVTIRHLALSDDDFGDLPLPQVPLSVVQANYGGASTEWAGQDAYAGVPWADVQCRTVDSLADMAVPLVVKLDLEGGEVAALAGAAEVVAKRQTVWYVEDADARPAARETIRATFREYGYAMWRHLPTLGAPWPQVVSENLLAVPPGFPPPPALPGLEAINA